MTNTEFKEMIEEGRVRDQERRERLTAKIKEEFPGLELDGLKTGGSLYGDYRIYLNNLEYIGCDGVYCYRRPTDLGLYLGWAVEKGRGYELVETGYRTVLLEEYAGTWAVWSYEFFTDSGSKLKGRRITKKVHQSSKGHYVELNGKRHYVSFLNNNEGGLQ